MTFEARNARLTRALTALLRSTRAQAADELSAKAGVTHSLTTVIALWRDISLFAAAFVYLAGWTYVRSYYREFEIDVNLLDIAFNNYFVYGFFALLGVSAILLVLALLLSVLLVEHFGGRKIIHAALLVAFAFGLFHVARVQGLRDGRLLRANF